MSNVAHIHRTPPETPQNAPDSDLDPDKGIVLNWMIAARGAPCPPGCKGLLMVLASWAARTRGIKIHGTVEEPLHEQAGLSYRQYQRQIKKIEAAGLVVAKRQEHFIGKPFNFDLSPLWEKWITGHFVKKDDKMAGYNSKVNTGTDADHYHLEKDNAGGSFASLNSPADNSQSENRKGFQEEGNPEPQTIPADGQNVRYWWEHDALAKRDVSDLRERWAADLSHLMIQGKRNSGWQPKAYHLDIVYDFNQRMRKKYGVAPLNFAPRFDSFIKHHRTEDTHIKYPDKYLEGFLKKGLKYDARDLEKNRRAGKLVKQETIHETLDDLDLAYGG